MKRTTLLLLLLGTLLMSACNFTGIRIVTGSGIIAEESRDVSGFDAVDISGSGDVIITQGDAEGVTIEAEENLLPYIRTDVRGRTLYIYIDHTNLLTINTSRPMRFHVSMKDVTGLETSGSGSITSEKITTDRLDIDISGSGSIKIENLKAGQLTADVSGSGDIKFDNLETDRLRIDISGSGDSVIKGKAEIQELKISGSGACDHSGLKSKEVSIDVSGAGSVLVDAENTLNVTISGSGDVVYSGTPKMIQKISGSGDIRAK